MWSRPDRRVWFRRSAASAVALVAVVSLPAPLAAAERKVVLRGAETGPRVRAERLDVDLRDLPLAREWEPGDPIKEIPRRTTHPRATPGAAAQEGEAVEDPLLQRQLEAEGRAPLDPIFTTPILNFPGQGFTGVTPPDTVGDVGPDHYIQAVNHNSGTSITIYSKTGAVLAGPLILDTLGSGGSCASGFGDPVVLYDALADRWLLSEFAGSGNNLCVYISQTNDPVGGGWFRYQFTTPNFPDYPKYAVWPDAYYVASNENSPAAYALDRARMLQGLSATSQRFTAPDLGGFGFQALTPADFDGSNPPPPAARGIFMRHRDDEAHNPPGTPNDFLEIWEFHVDWTTPANSTFSGPTNIPVTDFSSELCGFFSFSCFPQPGTGTRLDPLREVIMFRLQYRNYGSHQALAGNLVTDADGEGGGDPLERGGVRWFELRKTGGSWSLFQEGTYSPDTTNRWMGGSALDGAGNFAVGYNVSSGSVFPGLRYAGRLASDAPGTLPQGEATIVSGTASNSSNRYGDYSALSVDPADDCTFWFTGEYNTSPSWSTRIASFKFDSCGQGERNLIVNGGFEGGCNPWGFLSNGVRCVQGGPFPHGGTGYGQFGQNSADGRFHQDVVIPEDAPANLRFWLNVTTEETTPGAQNDKLFVEVRNTGNTLLATLGTFSNLDATAPGNYSAKTFSMADFAGSLVRLTFRVKTNGSLPTTFRVDDVLLR